MTDENSVRGAVMDAITALQRLLALLEGQGTGREVKPAYEQETPTTINVKCKDETRLLYYGDKYCSGGGRKIKW